MQNDRDGLSGGTTTTGTDRETGLGGIGGGTSAGFDGSGGGGKRTEQVKSKAKDAGHRAVDKIEDRAEEQKERATHQLEDLARSLRTASDQLPADSGMARYMGLAASQADNLAGFLNNHEVADLVDDVEDFARRQPAVFLGGAFAVGMLGARFLKSSRRNLVDEGVRNRWDTQEMTSRVRDPEADAISRPGAPGYAAPSDRSEGGFGDPTVR